MEHEENGELPFLDCLVTKDNDKFQTSVYRKPTHTSRLLDNSSYHPVSHKFSTITTLIKRAQIVCRTTKSIDKELHHLKQMFRISNYNQPFVERQLTGPLNPFKPTANEEEDATKTVTFPYTKDTPEKIPRILRPYAIKVAHRPMTTLQSVLT